MCEHPYLKGLRIARHNNTVHLITQTLQANKHTRFYTLTNAGNIDNMNQEQLSQNGSQNAHAHKQVANAKLD